MSPIEKAISILAPLLEDGDDGSLLVDNYPTLKAVLDELTEYVNVQYRAKIAEANIRPKLPFDLEAAHQRIAIIAGLKGFLNLDYELGSNPIPATVAEPARAWIKEVLAYAEDTQGRRESINGDNLVESQGVTVGSSKPAEEVLTVTLEDSDLKAAADKLVDSVYDRLKSATFDPTFEPGPHNALEFMLKAEDERIRADAQIQLERYASILGLDLKKALAEHEYAPSPLTKAFTALLDLRDRLLARTGSFVHPDETVASIENLVVQFTLWAGAKP
jgi:hypothetical protein